MYNNVYYELEYKAEWPIWQEQNMKIEKKIFEKLCLLALPKHLFGELTDTDTEYSAETYFGPSLIEHLQHNSGRWHYLFFNNF